MSIAISDLELLDIEEKILNDTIEQNLQRLYLKKNQKKNENDGVTFEVKDSTAYPRGDMKIEVFKKILKILINRRFGVSHTELAKILQKDRKNLSKYMNFLIEIEWVYRVNDGKNYHINPLFLRYGDYYTKISSLQQNLNDELGFSIMLESHFENLKFGKSPYPIYDDIIYFANKIGSIFILLSLFVMDSRQNLLTKSLDSAHEKDLFARKWIGDLLSILAPTWLEDFRWTIYPSLAGYICDVKTDEGCSISLENRKKIHESLGPQKSKQQFNFDSELIDILNNLFNDVYPSIYRTFEEVKIKTQNDIDHSKSLDSYNNYRRLASSYCEHDFFDLSDLNWGDQWSDRKHCKRCHKSFKK